MGSTTPSKLNLKFIFANHDGVVVEYTSDPNMLVKDLKSELMGQWPQGLLTGEFGVISREIRAGWNVIELRTSAILL